MALPCRIYSGVEKVFSHTAWGTPWQMLVTARMRAPEPIWRLACAKHKTDCVWCMSSSMKRILSPLLLRTWNPHMACSETHLYLVPPIQRKSSKMGWPGVPGWLSRLGVQLLILAQVVNSPIMGLSSVWGSAMTAWSLLGVPPLCLIPTHAHSACSLLLSPSLSKEINKL